MSKKLSKKRKEIRNRCKNNKTNKRQMEEKIDRKIPQDELLPNQEPSSDLASVGLVVSEFLCLSCYTPKMSFEQYIDEYKQRYKGLIAALKWSY